MAHQGVVDGSPEDAAKTTLVLVPGLPVLRLLPLFLPRIIILLMRRIISMPNSSIFYGKGGRVAANRPEEQEVSVLSLHLLLLSLAYVDTLMIQEVLSAPSWSGRITAEDLGGLPPPTFGHVNPYGGFELDMKQRLPLGGWRGLPRLCGP